MLARFLGILKRSLLTLVIAVVAVGSVAYATTTFTDNGAAAPGSTTENVLSIGSDYQTKVGNFWANTIGSTAGYCIGAACISSWPVFPTIDAGQCQICFHVASDGPGTAQCGGTTGGIPVGGGTTCAPINSWTTVYRDDTDDRSGGCQEVWKIDCTAPYGDGFGSTVSPPTTGDPNFTDWSAAYSGSYDPLTAY